MPLPHTSERMPSASALTAALLAPYAVRVSRMPRMLATDEISTRCPAPWARKISIAASHWACAPSTLVCRAARLAHALPVPTEAPLPMPALTITRSNPPRRSASAGTTVATDSGSSTSSTAVSTRIPGMGVQQLLLQGLEAVGTAGGEREVAAHRGEPAGHALAESGAGAGDQDASANGMR